MGFIDISHLILTINCKVVINVSFTEKNLRHIETEQLMQGHPTITVQTLLRTNFKFSCHK